MKRGFTLIELLIVVGVLAILAIAVVIVINPSELLKRGRDTQRVADLKTLRNAIDLYLVRSNANPLNIGCSASSYATWRGTVADTAMSANQQAFISSGALNGTQSSVNIPTASMRTIGGSGWVPIIFTTITGGSPISKLPVDPTNQISSDLVLGNLMAPNVLLPVVGSYFYAYQCFGLTYEIIANMESIKYGTQNDLTTPDLESIENSDGGTRARYLPGGATCVDPANVGTPCNVGTGGFALPRATFLADQIYQVGNDPGLDL